MTTEPATFPARGRPAPWIARVFLGPQGVRSGWRVLAFAVVAFVIAVVLWTAANPLRHRIRGAPALALNEPIPFLAVLLATWIMGRIEKRSMGDYFLPGRGAFGARFWQGGAWGFAALATLLLVIHLGHGFDAGGLLLHGQSLAGYALLWAVTFVFVSLFEEMLTRGYALATLARGIRFWPASVLLSVLFGAMHYHNGGENLVGCTAAGLVGLFFCFTVRRTGSLWFAIGFHASWDYSESFLFSVPDSGTVIPGHLLQSSFHGPPWLTGGSVGPEGSALIFLVIPALFLLFNRFYQSPAPAGAGP
jgi:membrane protease YdiL (CAAX protease family)